MAPIPCLICYRVISQDEKKSQCQGHTDNDEDGESISPEMLAMFFQFLGRHLAEDKTHGNVGKPNEPVVEEAIRFPVEQAIEGGFRSCGDCSKILKSFCNLFNQMKSVELLLNWKLETLKNVISCAHRAPSRMKAFRQIVDKMDSDVSVDEMIGFKRDIVKQCSRKLEASFPRLIVKKHQHGEAAVEQPVLQEKPTARCPQSDEEGNEIKIEVSEQSKSECGNESDYDTRENVITEGPFEQHVKYERPEGIEIQNNFTDDDPMSNSNWVDGDGKEANNLEQGEEALTTSTSLTEVESSVAGTGGNRPHSSALRDPSLPCHVCKRLFATKWNLRGHHKRTTCGVGRAPKPKIHKCHCQQCGMGFTRTTSLKNHLEEIHLQIKYPCDGCGKLFTNRGNLRAHKRKFHPERD